MNRCGSRHGDRDPRNGWLRMGEPRALVEHFFRHEFRRLCAVLIRSLGVRRLELVDDVVQADWETLRQRVRAYFIGGIRRTFGVYRRHTPATRGERWLATRALRKGSRHCGFSVTRRPVSDVSMLTVLRVPSKQSRRVATQSWNKTGLAIPVPSKHTSSSVPIAGQSKDP
jgi:hypothetical protein